MPVSALLPEWRNEADDPGRTLAGIDAWSGGGGLAGLVAGFGGALTGLGARARLQYLDDFSRLHWDFRGGRERNLAPVATIDDTLRRLVLSAAPGLGLVGTGAPRLGAYDHVLMTGGMVRACVVKPRFLARLVAGGLGVREVVFLGGFRAFGGDEARIASELGIDADNEFDAMVAGVWRAFADGSPGPPARYRGPHGHEDRADRSWTTSSGLRLRVVAAPSSAPHLRRADTRDTYRHWVQSFPQGPASALIVTTPAYVPYQAALAVEELGVGAGLVVDTVATDRAANDLGEHTQPFGAQELLQELRAAIGGMRSLRDRLDP